jgi:hypothetical protein
MWMVDPTLMCRRHLLGEHVELHMLVGHLNKGRHLGRYIDNDLVEPRSIQSRHDELVEEMTRRGYNHESPLPMCSIHMTAFEWLHRIDRDKSLRDLAARCPDCRERMGEPK